MRTKQRTVQSLFSVVIIVTLAVTMFRPPAVFAQGVGGIKRHVNAQTGRVSFLLPESGLVLSAREALSGMSIGERLIDPASALVNRFGVEFGLKDPARELVETQKRQTDAG